MCCASVIHVVILLVAGFSNIVRSWLLLFFFLEFCPCKEWKGLLNCWTANNIFHSLYYIPTAACNLNSYSRGYFVRGGVKCKLHVHWRLHFRMNFWTLHLEFSSQNVNLSQYFGILVINVTVTVGAFVLFGTVTTEAPVTQIIINQWNFFLNTFLNKKKHIMKNKQTS